MNWYTLELNPIGDSRGKLVALEELKDIPFLIRRIYYIFDTTPDQERGKHSHKNLEQLLIAIDGCCDIILDDGINKEVVRLNRPDKALYIGKNVWREMREFSYGCKLLVLASEYYDEKEYIRNYQDFLSNI